MKIFLFFLFFAISLACQSAETSKRIYGFCFVDVVSLSELHQYLAPIALPSDQLDMMGPCLEVLLSDARSSLYEAYLQKRYRLNRTYKGSDSKTTAELVGGSSDHCRVELLKRRVHSKTSDELSLGKRGKIKRTEEDLADESRSQLLLRRGLPGELRLNNEQLYLTCTGGNNGNYILTLFLNSPNSGISTSLNVTQGQTVNIGSIAKDLAGKNRTLSVSDGLDSSKTTGHDNYDFFLTLL